MQRKQELDILSVLAGPLGSVIGIAVGDYKKLQEIRLRVGQPLQVMYDNQSWYVTKNGGLTRLYQMGILVEECWLRESFQRACEYSIYAYEDEIKNGYFTVRGGHRIGVAGKIIVKGGEIVLMKHIASMNIRVAHEKIGCGQNLSQYIIHEGSVLNTLLIAPPRAGKTTMLRDLIRILSVGNGQVAYTVGVVDERSELAACYMGIPQNNLGPRTDVLDCCPKSDGMLMLLRSMSPQVIAVDEIGSGKDMDALKYVSHAGCSILATIHGTSMEEVRTRPILRNLIDMRLFQRYILMENAENIGQVKAVYDERGYCIYSLKKGA